jgi:hypothetical protein
VLEQHLAIEKAVIERGMTRHGLIYDLATGLPKALRQASGGTFANNGIVTRVGAVKEAYEPHSVE